MNSSKMLQFLEGKPFPLSMPSGQGVVMELRCNLFVIIKGMGLGHNEKKAFKKGFKSYSYLETKTDIPIPIWVFAFPEPFGLSAVMFNGKMIEQKYFAILDKATERIHFSLLDGQILKAQHFMVLHPEAMKLFRNTIKKQLSMDFTQNDFDGFLTPFLSKPIDEI